MYLSIMTLSALMQSCSTERAGKLAGPETALIGPLCQLGCVDPDPDPGAPGVFLGNEVTPESCFFPGGADGDGLSDYCEKQLSLAFAPELYYWSADDVRREPYWVARRTPEGNIYIGYLPAYYRDTGSMAWGCKIAPWIHPSCGGHNGDAEAIFLLVGYNSETSHWVLNYAKLSQHEAYGEYFTPPGDSYPPILTYPSHPGTYPRVWVSMGKHANYATREECNAGGPLGTDTCTGNNAAARLEWSNWWNLGASAHPLRDCVASRNPGYEYYTSGRLECFWSGSRFRGWIPEYVGGLDSDPYGPRLRSEGF
jgi:hypothetical protein